MIGTKISLWMTRHLLFAAQEIESMSITCSLFKWAKRTFGEVVLKSRQISFADQLVSFSLINLIPMGSWFTSCAASYGHDLLLGSIPLVCINHRFCCSIVLGCVFLQKLYMCHGAIHKVRTPPKGHFWSPHPPLYSKIRFGLAPHPTPVQAYSCNTVSKYNKCKKIQEYESNYSMKIKRFHQ